MRFLVKLCVIAVGTGMRALVYPLVWSWFAVPLGAPPIGWAHALGLSVLVQGMTASPAVNWKATPDEDMATLVAGEALKPLLVLALGALWHACM